MMTNQVSLEERLHRGSSRNTDLRAVGSTNRLEGSQGVLAVLHQDDTLSGYTCQSKNK